MSSIIDNLAKASHFSTDEIRVQNLEIDLISPDPNQVRTVFDEDKLEELADSIKAKGLLNPIHVRSHNQGYTIITGERRYRAARMAGLPKLPCIVHEEEISEKDIRSLQLIENLQRQDLSAIETAKAFENLIRQGMKQRQIAVSLGISESTVSRCLAIARLPKEWLEIIEQHHSHATLMDLYAITREKNKTRKSLLYQKMMTQAGQQVEEPKAKGEGEKQEKVEFTDEQLEMAWTKLKRIIRKDRKSLTRYVHSSKIQRLLRKRMEG